MDFGLTVLPDPPYSRLLELLQLGEANGFTHGWTYDSHVLWQEPFPLLTMAAERTDDAQARPLRHEPRDARADRRSRARTRCCRTSPAAGSSWASGAATRRGG